MLILYHYLFSDSITATTLNNLGILLKSHNRYEDALPIYKEALDIRSKTLGDKHPDTIVSMHNLAELLISSRNEAEASAIQENILEIMEKQSNSNKKSNSNDTNKIENINNNIDSKIEINKSNETKAANNSPFVTNDNRNKFLYKNIEEKRKMQMDAINSTKSNQMPSSRKERKKIN
jgi:tetratricopeptide (TPR) repeat protein